MMPAQYCNLLTGYASLETLYRSLYFSKSVARRDRVPFEYANITDVPSYTGSYPSVLASAGVKYWIAAGNNWRAPFLIYGRWNEKSPFWWQGPDGKKVLYKVEKDYFITDATPEKGKAEEAKKKLDLSHLRVRVEPTQEWVEMFNSAWRLERDFFYSPKMNGVDWQAVRASYAKLLPLAGSRADLNFLLGEVLGELGNSHTYVSGGDEMPEERHLDHLSGFRDSRPVRVGNGARDQRQLDIFGEVLDVAFFGDKQGIEIGEPYWSFLASLAGYACDHWREPDQGIWEMRTEPRHYVYSKVMCWVALNRAVRLSAMLGYEHDVGRWHQTVHMVDSGAEVAGGVDAALKGLHPVTLLPDLRHMPVRRRHPRPFEVGRRRHQLLRSHVGPDDVARFDGRIGSHADLLGEALRLVHLVDARTLCVELPAVVDAAQAALLVAGQPERGAAMRAKFVDESHAAAAVAEGDKVLAQQPHPDRRSVRLRQLAGHGRRHPVAAQRFAHRRPRADAGDQFIVLRGKHRFAPFSLQLRRLGSVGPVY